MTMDIAAPIAARSALYVPGDSAKKLQRCVEWSADIVIVDLEDGVAPASKADARRSVVSWLSGAPIAPVWVRVNNSASLAADVMAIVGPGLSGICLPKTASASELVRLDGMLEVAELSAGLAPGSVGVWPLIESAAGVLAAVELAAAPRVVGLQIGEVDLMAELGLSASSDENELLPYRAAVVTASAAAGLGAPMAPVSPQWRDEELYRRSTESVARMGFGGRVCIHPRQVAIANEVFTPSVERLEWAQSILEHFDAAVSAGQGVLVDGDGQMVDEAVVRIARRIHALAPRAPDEHVRTV